ncbi:DUF6118 family protein [Blastomonas sp.]|uniref:DUF6118 family protein n=1 Tax=Blastomonas sp. TaxID=1909299 RepID=UPI00406A9B1D
MSDHDPEDIPIEQALEMIVQRLAGISTSMDGLAERQLDLLGRDYSAELAHIRKATRAMAEAIETLAARPALALTPELIARQIEVAASEDRNAEQAAWASARKNMESAITSLASVTASQRTARQQNQWLAAVAGLALVLGSIGGCTIPPAVDWVVPEAWHWPEKRAISALRRDGWQAAERLMSVSDPGQLRDVQAAVQLWQENADAIEICAKQARGRKLRSVGCAVEVPGGTR